MTKLRATYDRARLWLRGYWGGVTMRWRNKP